MRSVRGREVRDGEERRELGGRPVEPHRTERARGPVCARLLDRDGHRQSNVRKCVPVRGIFPPGRADGGLPHWGAHLHAAGRAERQLCSIPQSGSGSSPYSAGAQRWTSVLGQVPRGSKRPALHNCHLQVVHRWAILAPVPCRSRWPASATASCCWRRGEGLCRRRPGKTTLGTAWPRHRGDWHVGAP